MPLKIHDLWRKRASRPTTVNRYCQGIHWMIKKVKHTNPIWKFFTAILNGFYCNTNIHTWASSKCFSYIEGHKYLPWIMHKNRKKSSASYCFRAIQVQPRGARTAKIGISVSWLSSTTDMNVMENLPSWNKKRNFNPFGQSIGGLKISSKTIHYESKEVEDWIKQRFFQNSLHIWCKLIRMQFKSLGKIPKWNISQTGIAGSLWKEKRKCTR